MRCDASGSPTPEIHWYRRGSRIGTDTAGVRVEGNKLILSNVQNAEHGMFCVVFIQYLNLFQAHTCVAPLIPLV